MSVKVDRYGHFLLKPTPIVSYCKHMGGVDLTDQLTQYYDPLRRCRKWWKKLFFQLFSLMTLNAYKLYVQQKANPAKREHKAFTNTLVEQLIQSAPNAPHPKKRGRKSVEPLARLTPGNHFPAFFEAMPGAKRAHPQRDCVACNKPSSRKRGIKRHQSIYRCRLCDVSLCVPR